MSKLEKIVFDHGVCNLHSGEHTIDFLGIDRSDAVINIEVNSLTGILITSVKDIKTLTVNVDASAYLVLSFLFDKEILDPSLLFLPSNFKILNKTQSAAAFT